MAGAASRSLTARGYGIKSKEVRVDGIAGTTKGYDRADLEDGFAS
jgi:hypothetical protein